MKVKHIIFFVTAIFHRRDYERFGIEMLEKNGFSVEVWDFTAIFHPETVYGRTDFSWFGLRCFLNKPEMLKAISEVGGDCCVICLILYRLTFYSVYRALSKNRVKYCVSVVNVIPGSSLPEVLFLLFNDLFQTLKEISLRRLLNIFFLRIPYSWVGVNPVNILFAGGMKSLKTRYPLGKNTEILSAHSMDYDVYLKDRESFVEPDDSMAVFLDQCALIHPDDIYRKYTLPLGPDEYYPPLCRFFDFVEEKYKVKVVVAAHPRANYDGHPEYFGNRPILKNKTLQLIRNSRFVIAHSSTAINFAVLHKKPIVFVTTRKYDLVEGSNIDSVASSLQKKQIYIDRPFTVEDKEFLSIDEKVYDGFKSDYIKQSCSEDIPLWQIIANRMKQLN